MFILTKYVNLAGELVTALIEPPGNGNPPLGVTAFSGLVNEITTDVAQLINLALQKFGSPATTNADPTAPTTSATDPNVVNLGSETLALPSVPVGSIALLQGVGMYWTNLTFNKATKQLSGALGVTADGIILAPGSAEVRLYGQGITGGVTLANNQFNGFVLTAATLYGAVQGALVPGQIFGLSSPLTQLAPHDQTNFYASLPLAPNLLSDVITGLSPTGAGFGTFVSALAGSLSKWQVAFNSTLMVAGFPLGTVSGIVFGPQLDATGAISPQQLVKQFVVNADQTQPGGTPAYNTTPFTFGSPSTAASGTPTLTLRSIPVTTTAEYNDALTHGGLLLTGQLFIPNLIADPAATTKSIDWTPSLDLSDPLKLATQIQTVQTWVGGIIGKLTASTPWGHLQLYVPILGSGSPGFIDGASDLRVLGTDLGTTRVQGTALGLQAPANVPWLGGLQTELTSGTVSVSPADFLNQLIGSPLLGRVLSVAGLSPAAFSFLTNNSLVGGLANISLPIIGAGASPSTTRLARWLAGPLGLSPSAAGGAAADVFFGAYSPGFGAADPTATGVKKTGGFVLDGNVTLPGLVNDANVDFEIDPFSVLSSTDPTTALIPDYELSAAIPQLTIPLLGSAADLLTVTDAQLSGSKDDAGDLSLNLSGWVSVLGTSLSMNAALAASPAGLVANAALNGGSDATFTGAGFTTTGAASLQINTTNATQLGVPANTAQVHVHGTLTLAGGFSITGNFDLSVVNGRLAIRVNGTASLLQLGSVTVAGYLTADTTGLVGGLAVAASTLAPTIPNLTVSGAFELDVNTTGAAQAVTGLMQVNADGSYLTNRTVTIPANTARLTAAGALTAGGLTLAQGRIYAAVGAQGLALAVGGQTQTLLGLPGFAAAGGMSVAFTLGVTSAWVVVGGSLSGGQVVQLTGAGLTLAGATSFRLNPTGATASGIPVGFAVSVSGTLATSLGGGFSVAGAFGLSQSNGQTVVAVAGTMNLGPLGTAGVTGGLVGGTGGLAGGWAVSVNTGTALVGLAGTLQFELNTFPTAQSVGGLAAIVAGQGVTTGSAITIPANTARLVLGGTLTAGGLPLTNGRFEFTATPSG